MLQSVTRSHKNSYTCSRFPTVDPDFLQKKGQEFGFGEGSEERLNHWVEANIDKGYKQVSVPAVFIFYLYFFTAWFSWQCPSFSLLSLVVPFVLKETRFLKGPLSLSKLMRCLLGDSPVGRNGMERKDPYRGFR